MKRVKIFVDRDEDNLELEINKWLQNNPELDIFKIKQSSGDSYTAISIWYTIKL